MYLYIRLFVDCIRDSFLTPFDVQLLLYRAIGSTAWVRVPRCGLLQQRLRQRPALQSAHILGHLTNYTIIT